jgi:membrane protease YdiL (CAAX protease family)
MWLVGVVWVVATVATGFALRPELSGAAHTWQMWGALGIPYLLLSGVAIVKLHRDGRLVERLRPKWGDISIGIIVAAVLISGSWAARALLTPSGTQRQAWLYLIYAQVGPSEAIQRSSALTATLLGVAALEEIVWRGLVLDELKQRVGERRAWLLTAALYAIAAVPTVFTLAHPVAGPNPLLFIAALGCGLFWSFTASIMGRLPPVMISHMVFSYFVVVQFRPPGL